MIGDYNDPQLLDRSDLDLSQLRRHVREMHPAFRRGIPRSNIDLASWHSREHHRLYCSHRHLGLLTMIWDRAGRKPVAVTPRPEGNFTGKDAVTREQDAAEWRAKHPQK